MRFDLITLFPELFTPFLVNGVTRRAYEAKLVDVRLWNPRDFAEGTYRRVDDRPFGGGPGMVMMAEPLALCLEKIKADRALDGAPEAPVVLFSPVGQVLDHAAVESWSASAGAVLVCGRYEGLDQRFIDRWRREQRLALSQRQRPELVHQARAAGQLTKQDEAYLLSLDSAKQAKI